MEDKQKSVIENRFVKTHDNRDIRLLGVHHGHAQHIQALHDLYNKHQPSHILAEIHRLDSRDHVKNATELKTIFYLAGEEGMIPIDRDELITMERVCHHFKESKVFQTFTSYMFSFPFMKPKFSEQEWEKFIDQLAILCDYESYFDEATKPCDENMSEDEIQEKFWEVINPFLETTNIKGAITQEREEIMFYKICQFLLEHPEAKNIFVVTGKYHTKSLAKRFEEFEANYKENDTQQEGLLQIDMESHLSEELKPYQRYITQQEKYIHELTTFKNPNSMVSNHILGAGMGYMFMKMKTTRSKLIWGGMCAIAAPMFLNGKKENHPENFSYGTQTAVLGLGIGTGVAAHKIMHLMPKRTRRGIGRLTLATMLIGAGTMIYRGNNLVTQVKERRNEIIRTRQEQKNTNKQQD